MAKTLQHITTNVGGPSVRHEELDGRPHLVVPMVMIVDGVHAGSDGALFYPSSELRKNVSGWDSKPVVINHPSTGTANDPAVLNAQKVGIILRSKYKAPATKNGSSNTKVTPGKLAAEAWLDEELLKNKSLTVYNALASGEMVEVSTGLFTDLEDANGTYNGKPYSLLAKNYRPDHLAILPDAKGACSIADGAGLLRLNKAAGPDNPGAQASAIGVVQELVGRLRLNEQSYSDKSEQLSGLIQAANANADKPYSIWVDDFTDSKVIYRKDGKVFAQDYKADKTGKLSLSGVPTEVRIKKSYVTLDGKAVANMAAVASSEETMSKQAIVDKLIGNGEGHWKTADREWLMSQDDARLAQLAPVAPAAAPVQNAAAALVVAPAAPATAPAAPAAPQPLTINQYIDNAPPEMRDSLHMGMMAATQLRASHIQTITKNTANVFTQQQLEAMPLNQLEGLAKLAGSGSAQGNPNQYVPPVNYGGAAGGPPLTTNQDGSAEPDALEMPVINYGADK